MSSEQQVTVNEFYKILPEPHPELASLLDTKDISDAISRFEQRRPRVEEIEELLWNVVNSKGNREKNISFLAGFLFYLLRPRADQGSFNHEKEQDQIQGEAAILTGKHLSGKTGLGKSSVLGPVSAFLYALCRQYDNQSVQMCLSVPDDETLLESTMGHLHLLRNALLASITDSSLQEEIRNRVRILEYPAKKNNEKPLSKLPDPLLFAEVENASILVKTQHDTVFPRLENEGTWGQATAPTLIDEVSLVADQHFALRGASVQARGVEQINLESETDIRALGTYCLGRIIYEAFTQMIKDKKIPYELQGGERVLSAGGVNKVKELAQRLESLSLEQFAHVFEELGIKDTSKALEVVEKYIQEEKRFSTGMFESGFRAEHFFETWKPTAQIVSPDDTDFIKPDDQLSPAEHMVYALAEEIIQTSGRLRRGQHYSGVSNVRDRSLGRTREGFEYYSHVEEILRIIERAGPLLTSVRTEKQTMSFYSWVRLVMNKNIIGMSNDLGTWDPDTGERILTMYGKILEAATGRRVEDLSKADPMPPIPAPVIEGDSHTLLQKVANDLREGAATRPQLVFCWDDLDGEYLYALLKENSSCAFINSSTSEDDEWKYFSQFAHGGIKILISTGRGSVGRDIKTTEGVFPDFKVSVINPASGSQYFQAFGRRRLEKTEKDISVYFDRETFASAVSELRYEKAEHSKKKWLVVGGKEISVEEAMLLVDKAVMGTSTPAEKERLAALERVILSARDKKIQLDIDEDFESEKEFIEVFRPQFSEQKRNVIEKWVAQEGSLEPFLSEEISKLRELMGGSITASFEKQIREVYAMQVKEHLCYLDDFVFAAYRNFLIQVAYDQLLSNKALKKQHIVLFMTKYLAEEVIPRWKAELGDVSKRTEKLTEIFTEISRWQMKLFEELALHHPLREKEKSERFEIASAHVLFVPRMAYDESLYEADAVSLPPHSSFNPESNRELRLFAHGQWGIVRNNKVYLANVPWSKVQSGERNKIALHIADMTKFERDTRKLNGIPEPNSEEYPHSSLRETIILYQFPQEAEGTQCFQIIYERDFVNRIKVIKPDYSTLNWEEKLNEVKRRLEKFKNYRVHK